MSTGELLLNRARRDQPPRRREQHRRRRLDAHDVVMDRHPGARLQSPSRASPGDVRRWARRRRGRADRLFLSAWTMAHNMSMMPSLYVKNDASRPSTARRASRTASSRRASRHGHRAGREVAVGVKSPLAVEQLGTTFSPRSGSTMATRRPWASRPMPPPRRRARRRP